MKERRWSMTRGIVDCAANHRGLLPTPSIPMDDTSPSFMTVAWCFRRTCSFSLNTVLTNIWLFELVPKYIHELIRINTKNWKFSLLTQCFPAVWKTIKNSGNHLWQFFFVLRSIKMIWQYKIKCLQLTPFLRSTNFVNILWVKIS